MELWCTEWETRNLGLATRIKETLFVGQSEFQKVAIVDSEQFGRLLVLDGVFQTSVFDEYIYHEMIAHVPMCVHPDPKRILVIGGGDGGTVREVLRHSTVERVEMVEIDGMVIEACKKFLPETSEALIKGHPNFMLKIGDGIAHMRQASNEYDIIIVDCSDPIGPGEGLFTHAFYQDVHKALKPDGLFVQQTESPFYHQPLIQRLYKDVASLFPIARVYLAPIPIYPGGTHTFTIGSKEYDPALAEVRQPGFTTKYYNPELHKSAFVLPNFMREFLENSLKE